jgi:hypothetical protein
MVPFTLITLSNVGTTTSTVAIAAIIAAILAPLVSSISVPPPSLSLSPLLS